MLFKGGTACNLFFYRPLPRYHFYLLILYIGLLKSTPSNNASAGSSQDLTLMRGFGKIVRLLLFCKFPSWPKLFPFFTALLTYVPQFKALDGFYAQGVNMKFITRELEKYPTSVPHTLMQGHFYLMNRSFQDALGIILKSDVIIVSDFLP